MSLREHLCELRKRITRAAISIIIAAVAGWFLFPAFWDALRHPIDLAAAEAGSDGKHFAINFATITGAFDIRMQVAIVLGVVLSSPVWLYQLVAFIAPGLVAKEKRYLFGFLGVAIPLFLGGVTAGWFVTPHVVELLSSFVPSGSSALYDARSYLDFVLKLMIASGVAFVLPLLLVFLNFVGLISGRSVLKSWRWAILAIGLFTAIATPASDVISMFLLAAPMVALYFAAAGTAMLNDRRNRRTLERNLEAVSIDVS
jgi:sec-independent protein translocase protein TatC